MTNRGQLSRAVAWAISVIDISRRRSNPFCTCRPELREYVPVKRFLVTVLATLSLAALAACGSSTTRTQSLSPSTPDSSASHLSTSPQSSSSSGTTSRSASKPVPTPSVTPAAQSAVNAYVGLYNLTSALGLDPAHANTSKIAPYVTAATLPQWRQVFATMAKNGVAYRGIPDDPHLKVVSASGQSVVLSSCPTPNSHDPYIQYVVATGKPVPTTTSKTLRPKAITVLYVSGRWRVASVIPDEGRICRP